MDNVTEERKELFSERIPAGKRTYYFDVKETVEGSSYLIINEAKHMNDTVEKHKIMIFEDDIISFFRGMKKTVKFMVDRSMD